MFKLQEAELISSIIIKGLTPMCEAIAVAGSVRRQRLEVKDVDIVLIPHDIEAIKRKCLEDWGPTDSFLSGDEKKPKWGERMAHFWYMGAFPVDLYFADLHTWPTLLLIRTGSKEHNIKMCTTAKSKGMYLAADGSGLFADRQKQNLLPVELEEDIFKHLGLPYLPPEQREHRASGETG